jgi:hypothetical protein
MNKSDPFWKNIVFKLPLGNLSCHLTITKGYDVFSYGGNAKVGYSEDNFVFDKRHRPTRI